MAFRNNLAADQGPLIVHPLRHDNHSPGPAIPPWVTSFRSVGHEFESRTAHQEKKGPPAVPEALSEISDYLITAAPAPAITPSCCAEPPETPMAPMILPLSMIGTPPSMALMPSSVR